MTCWIITFRRVELFTIASGSSGSRNWPNKPIPGYRPLLSRARSVNLLSRSLPRHHDWNRLVQMYRQCRFVQKLRNLSKLNQNYTQQITNNKNNLYELSKYESKFENSNWWAGRYILLVIYRISNYLSTLIAGKKRFIHITKILNSNKLWAQIIEIED